VRRRDLELGLPPTSQFDPAALQAPLAGQPELQELRLALSGLTLPLGGWAAALPLRTLCIDQLAGPLLLEASLCWPPSLRALRLHGEPLQLRAALPGTLTRLEIGWLQRRWGLELPRQVSELTGLRELELWGQTDQNSRDLECLSSLAQLSRLELRGYHDLAAILPLVPNLEELSVGALVNSTTADALRRALEHTPRLTHLIGSDASDRNFEYVLEAMQGSTQLRLLSMSTFKELSEPSCHSSEPERMQAAAGIGPDLRIQLDCPPDVHAYWPDCRARESSLPHKGLPGLPPALLALLHSARIFAEHIYTQRGKYDDLHEFDVDLTTTRRLPDEPLLQAISRTLDFSASAVALLSAADACSLVRQRFAFDECSKALAAALGERLRAVVDATAASVAEVEITSHDCYYDVHLELAFFLPDRTWLLCFNGYRM
jgi:hypothetical protein